MRELNHKLWPYKVSLNTDIKNDVAPVEYWLIEQTGKFRERWNVVYLHNRTDYYFKSGEDATYFALKWS